MLKKRILASSMASVMALSSVSVAAFADETKKDYGEAVTKAELEKYTDDLVDFIADELPTYGSKQGERFQAAFDHALKVLEDEDAEAADYTAAYQMVKAVKSELQVYTAKQLKALIDANKKKYVDNNEFNEELQDNIYTESSYSDFTAAYDDAERYVDSDDSMLITDAYIALDDAVNKLAELATVTKSQFRAALREYEELEYKMKNYETWRRGTLTVKSTTGTSKNIGDVVKKEAVVTFGDLQNMVYGVSDSVNLRYYEDNTWKTFVPGAISEDDKGDGHADTDGRWIGSFEIGASANLMDFITEQYNLLDAVKGATETSNAQMVAAYEAAVDAVAVFNGWKPDNYKTGSKGSCANLLKKYRPQLVEEFDMVDNKIGALINALDFDKAGGDSGSGWLITDKDSDGDYDAGDKKFTLKHDLEAHTLKANAAVYIIKDKNTGLWVTPSGASSVTDCIWKTHDEADTVMQSESGKADMVVQKVSAGTNLLTYMDYTPLAASDINTAKSGAQSTYAGVVSGASALIDSADWATKKVEADGDAVVTEEAKYTGSSTDTYKKIKKTSDNAGDDPTSPNAAHAKQTDIDAHNDAVDDIKEAYDALKSAIDNLSADRATYWAAFSAAEDNYDAYKDYKFPANESDALLIMNTLADGKTIPKPSGSSTEWTLIWRKLAYALDDMFPVVTKDKTSLADLRKMIDRAYDICEKTGDSSLFAEKHKLVVEERQTALDWYKQAKATTGYKTTDKIDNRLLSEVYSDLKSDVETLEKWLKGFQYSYGEISADIAKIADAIEKGEVKGDELKKALKECAYDLSVLQPSDVFDDGDSDINVAFDSERIFQAPNRLKTDKQKSKVKPNEYEKNLKKSYEALKEAYEKAVTGGTPSGVVGDVDADGVVTFDDVQLVIDASLKGETDAKYDVNGDKVVDFDDVQKAIDLFLATQA